MTKRRPLAFLISSLIFLATFSCGVLVTFAQTAVIDATVKINVCGDALAEGPEECDNSDLRNKSCGTYGYDSGTLSCNSDCSISTVNCTLAGESDNSDDTSLTSDNVSLPSSQTNAVSTIIRDIPFLPSSMTKYDTNGDNRLDFSEIRSSLNVWYGAWKGTSGNISDCDVDEDSECSIRDFSIFMFYVNNE